MRQFDRDNDETAIEITTKQRKVKVSEAVGGI